MGQFGEEARDVSLSEFSEFLCWAWFSVEGTSAQPPFWVRSPAILSAIEIVSRKGPSTSCSPLLFRGEGSANLDIFGPHSQLNCDLSLYREGRDCRVLRCLAWYFLIAFPFEGVIVGTGIFGCGANNSVSFVLRPFRHTILFVILKWGEKLIGDGFLIFGVC